jgi:hypothetical protein
MKKKTDAVAGLNMRQAAEMIDGEGLTQHALQYCYVEKFPVVGEVIRCRTEGK